MSSGYSNYIEGGWPTDALHRMQVQANRRAWAREHHMECCAHCGHIGWAGQDHSCLCPHADADCPDHIVWGVSGD